MPFNPDAQLDPSQVEDRRGSGSSAGGPIMVGGGAVGLIVLIAALLLGVDPTGLIDTTAQPPIEGAQSAQECRTGADANKREDCRVVGFVDSVQKYWGDEFNRRGSTYTPATTVLFTGATQAACGTASAATGPFYCPNDQKVYLDTGFFQELTSRFGAKGGEFAEGYVIAHEYGHHVQDELGLLQQSASSNRASVRVELQADCFAGVWAKHAADTGFLVAPTDADIAQAVDAAGAVGDDRITQGRVAPDNFTHGTSEQRQTWFKTGYTSGDMDRCDTSRV
ncbi:MAG: neutral zinc metallopeptidase [Chloroflexota bacterium]